ncbi:hypothetical protein CUJ84_pRLN1000409 (plasmid) [Rhizobium leguminosarum]|uniref:Uncharacterized protein n=1 Tax=Rhizobium leguminosarum TaxID=384 RepID=A0A2K9ZCA3_RHILE|nr:hypothetical protein CUJ84_pRLN1000409 [Rhizobium leguminosarum]
MHKQAPPNATVNKWLISYPALMKGYGHILLEQIAPGDATIREGLRPYFESAHSDARDYFHAYAGMSLHPDAGAPGFNAKYPNCLPSKARRGVFGEVMSGLMTEALDFVGHHQWVVPVFLFRNQEDARQYIYVLSRDPLARERSLAARATILSASSSTTMARSVVSLPEKPNGASNGYHPFSTRSCLARRSRYRKTRATLSMTARASGSRSTAPSMCRLASNSCRTSSRNWRPMNTPTLSSPWTGSSSWKIRGRPSAPISFSWSGAARLGAARDNRCWSAHTNPPSTRRTETFRSSKSSCPTAMP